MESDLYASLGHFICASRLFSRAYITQVSPSPYLLRFSKVQPEGNVQVQYYLSGKFPHFAESEPEGDLSLLLGESVVRIPTRFDDADATGLSALIYQPGCVIQYLRVEDLKNAPRSEDLACVFSEPVHLQGMIQNYADGGATNLVAEVHYHAYREHRIDETIVITIVSFNLGPFPISDDGSFSWPLPDFGNDVILNQKVRHGQFDIWVHRDHTRFHWADL